MSKLTIHLAAVPGLEAPLRDEALACGFHNPRLRRGGVQFEGQWAHVWRANLLLRGAVRVLVQIGTFKAHHLSQLGPATSSYPWSELIAPGTPFRVEATCRKSRLNHAGAVAQRITDAISASVRAHASLDEAGVVVQARVDKDHVTLLLDTSGAPLHRRGHKQAVGKAPLRETIAAMCLREAGFDGTQCLVDPMCGSGTFPIEASEIAAGLAPGRDRAFAFEHLRSFDAEAWRAMKDAVLAKAPRAPAFGSDRDAGVITQARANATRAGVAEWCHFERAAISARTRPDGPPGLVMVNPPYGARIGDRRTLFALYGALGKTLTAQFRGWRLGLVTSDGGLAQATGLDLSAGGPINLGGLTIRLYQAAL